MDNEQRIKELEDLVVGAAQYGFWYANNVKHHGLVPRGNILQWLNTELGPERSVATESPSSTEADKITNNPLLGEQVIYVPDDGEYLCVCEDLGNYEYKKLVDVRQTTLSSYIKELNRV
jgi:hypothetical protein